MKVDDYLWNEYDSDSLDIMWNKLISNHRHNHIFSESKRPLGKEGGKIWHVQDFFKGHSKAGQGSTS